MENSWPTLSWYYPTRRSQGLDSDVIELPIIWVVDKSLGEGIFEVSFWCPFAYSNFIGIVPSRALGYHWIVPIICSFVIAKCTYKCLNLRIFFFFDVIKYVF